MFLLILWQIIIRILAKIFPFPAPFFIGPLLNSRLRKIIQPPQQLIKRSGIQKGMQVLDLGCGSGAFTLDIVRTVGETGGVYAVDIQPQMLKQLKNKLAKPENRNIKNIKLKIANADTLPFTNNFFDLVNMVTVLPEIPDKPKALGEIRRVLKPKGVLAVTELLGDPHYPLKSTTIEICTNQGFIVDQVAGHFWNYTVKFRKL